MSHTIGARRIRRAGLALLACAASAVAAPPAQADDGIVADTTAASRQECLAPVFGNPFVDFKDRRDYVLAPGGSFDDPSGAGWQLLGGAQVVEDDSRDGTVNGSLLMPSGSVAVSPVMCVDMTYPTARMWARTIDGDGDVAFSVSYAGTKTQLKPQGVGHVKGDHGRWKLSSDVHIKPELAGKDDGWRKVAFVLTAGGKNGRFQIDDLYVDPRLSR
jgi:hypothetical protein